MVGVKGRSGKATRLETKLLLSAAGKKAGRGRPLNAPPPPPPLAPDAKDADDRLGLPVTWGDELKRKQVEGEALQNLKRQIEVRRAEVELQRAKDEADEARAALVPRKELDKTAALIRDAWWKSAQQITSDILAALPGLPMEARELIKRASDESVAKAAERVKASLA